MPRRRHPGPARQGPGLAAGKAKGGCRDALCRPANAGGQRFAIETPWSGYLNP